MAPKYTMESVGYRAHKHVAVNLADCMLPIQPKWESTNTIEAMDRALYYVTHYIV